MTRTLSFIRQTYYKKSKIIITCVLIYMLILFFIPTNIFDNRYDAVFLRFLDVVKYEKDMFPIEVKRAMIEEAVYMALSFVFAIIIAALSYKFPKILPVIVLSIIVPTSYVCNMIKTFTVTLPELGSVTTYTQGQLAYSAFYLILCLLLIIFLIMLTISLIVKKFPSKKSKIIS